MRKKTMKAAVLALTLGTVFQLGGCGGLILTAIFPALLTDLVFDNGALLDLFNDGPAVGVNP